MGCTSHHPCEKRIPIFPVRYTVIPATGGSATAYKHSDLETGFPALKNSYYTLRLVREGFVYLYDETEDIFYLWRAEGDGRFTELLATTVSLQSVLDENYTTGSRARSLWAKENSTVYIGYTDTLLTDAKLNEIKDNTDGY